MTNKEIQELVDEQPVYILSCVSARVSKLYEQKWELEDRIIKAIEYINQGTELCEGEYTNYCDNLGRETLLNILQGSDKE